MATIIQRIIGLQKHHMFCVIPDNCFTFHQKKYSSRDEMVTAAELTINQIGCVR